VGVQLFDADGQTDMKKLIVTCRKFAKTPHVIRSVAEFIRSQGTDLSLFHSKEQSLVMN
jgi:hypothetical protein